MENAQSVPDASVYRLSLYHCYLGEIIRTGGQGRVTSRRLASELGVKEETVRRDMSFVGNVGRPGAGYDIRHLFETLTGFLGLSDEYPVVKVGTAQMLSALEVVFPARSYGVRPVAYYSELEEDVGKTVGDIEVKHVTDLPTMDRNLGVTVALVACSPGWVQMTLDLLAEAGITGVLLLTPATRLNRPEGMIVSHVRMPCDIKSLACRCKIPVGGP
ncbi:MAG: winged-helix domain-containing protein [Coriobacteriia bacterium]|nr:winged-helix domain-containing protein [Coriobacteriia bacterium]